MVPNWRACPPSLIFFILKKVVPSWLDLSAISNVFYSKTVSNWLDLSAYLYMFVLYGFQLAGLVRHL